MYYIVSCVPSSITALCTFRDDVSASSEVIDVGLLNVVLLVPPPPAAAITPPLSTTSGEGVAGMSEEWHDVDVADEIIAPGKVSRSVWLRQHPSICHCVTRPSRETENRLSFSPDGVRSQ